MDFCHLMRTLLVGARERLWSRRPRRPALGSKMLLVTFALAASAPALGQRAEENAVTSAEDAFGTTIGRESIGLYSEDDVRGFSPASAGNVRIEGLFFDQP